jgi:hypothetical protein
MRGQTEQFGGGRTVRSLWVGLSQYENDLGSNRYNVGWCGLKCHNVGDGLIIRAPEIIAVFVGVMVSAMIINLPPF